MKRKLSILILICCLLTGCSSSAEIPATQAATQPAVSESTCSHRVIYPLPSAIDLDAMDNCIAAISLEEGDAYVDDSGVMQMRVRVYTYDLFDPVEIHQMKTGDTILLRGQEVPITQLQYADNGSVLINGGLDVGGYELITRENTVYFETGYSDMKAWQAVGTAIIPVSPDFEYTDCSDPDKAPTIYYAGDFLWPDTGIDYFFTPQNTTITIENGMVIAMRRIYMP